MGGKWQHRLSACIAALALLSSIAASDTALAQDPPAQPETIDDLFELFNIDDVRADFIVVIDESGSMSDNSNGQPAFPSVKTAYEDLVDLIPEGDHLSLITFAGQSQLNFNGVLDSSDTRAVAKSALPEIATGANTDIGSAIESAIDRLERADANDVQTVILLTDGQHSPDAGLTRYSGTVGPAWDELKTRADELTGTRTINVIGFEVGANTDIQLLSSVFPTPEIVALPEGQVSSYFEEQVRNSRLQRLRRAITTDLTRTVEISGSSERELSSTIETALGVHSTFEKLSVKVTVDSATAVNQAGDTLPVEIVSPRTFSLGPDAADSVRVRLDPLIEESRFRIGVSETSQTFDIVLALTVTPIPTDLLERVTNQDNSQSVTGHHVVRTESSSGISIKALLFRLLLLILLLLILRALYRKYLQVPKLVGYIDLGRHSLEGARFIRLKGKRMSLTQAQVPGASTAKVALYTKRRKRNRVFLSPLKQPVKEVFDGETPEALTGDIQLQWDQQLELGTATIRYVVSPEGEGYEQ